MPKAEKEKSRHGVHLDRSSRWGIVVNLGGETENDVNWKPIEFNVQLMHFYAWVKHRGEETERDHYHLFVHMRRAWSLKPLLTFLGVGNGYKHKLLYTDDINYLTDGHTTIDGPYIFGHQDVTAGTRTDISEALSMAKQGASVQDIITHQPQLMPYARIIDEYFIKKPEPTEPKRDVRVIVLYGRTNTGKSHRPKVQYFGDYFSIKSGRGPFDRYHGQGCVEFGEFRWQKWDISDMNDYLDDWYTELDCRGTGNNKISLWHTVVITSNTHPFTWYPNEPQELRDAFFSRLQHIIEVTSKEQEIDLKILPKIPRE